MTGTCVNSIKLMGLGSIGLLTGSLAYQSVQIIPKLINELNHNLTNDNWSLIKCGKVINKVLLGISTSCFVLSYKYSPTNEKHPYLIYALLGTLISYGYTYYQSCKLEKSLNKFSKPSAKPVTKPQPESVSEPVVPESGPDRDDDLGKSYIHVSDEDSTSATLTPTHSTPGSPRPSEPVSNPKLEEDDDIELEISMALFKKEMVNNSLSLKSIYLKGAGFLGMTFLISSIGVIGEFVMA